MLTSRTPGNDHHYVKEIADVLQTYKLTDHAHYDNINAKHSASVALALIAKGIYSRALIDRGEVGKPPQIKVPTPAQNTPS